MTRGDVEGGRGLRGARTKLAGTSGEPASHQTALV